MCDARSCSSSDSNRLWCQHTIVGGQVNATGHRPVGKRGRRSGTRGRRAQAAATAWVSSRICHGALAPVPRTSRNRAARSTKRPAASPERRRRRPNDRRRATEPGCRPAPQTQVGAALSDPGEAVEHVTTAVVESEQETPRQQAESGVCASSSSSSSPPAKVGAPTGQSRLRRDQHIPHEFMGARREQTGRLDRRQPAVVNWLPSPDSPAVEDSPARSGRYAHRHALADLGQTFSAYGG